MERGDKKTMKEFIRRTIMMQESMFKQQVKELHRLYYVQKSLRSLKEKHGYEKEKPPFLRDSAAPTWASFNSTWSENHSGNFPSVIGIKRTRSYEFKRHLIDDGCELELSLGIRGKATKTERTLRFCSSRSGLKISKPGGKLPPPATPAENLKLCFWCLWKPLMLISLTTDDGTTINSRNQISGPVEHGILSIPRL